MKMEVQKAGWSRWLNWTPEGRISRNSAGSEPTKPTEPGFDGFVGPVLPETPEIPPLETMLKARAVELYLADGDRLFIVADEADLAKLGDPRGTFYTAGARQVAEIRDPSFVAEVRRWKREFNATRARVWERG